jgi:hypothetical protein
MPIDYVVDPEHRAVFTVATGAFSVGDAISHMDRLRADGRFSPLFNQIADFDSVNDVLLSGLDVRTFAQQTVFSPTSRRALVLARPIAFGLGRMFTTLRELAGEPHVAIVKTLTEAAEWTGIDLKRAEEACDGLRRRLQTP